MLPMVSKETSLHNVAIFFFKLLICGAVKTTTIHGIHRKKSWIQPKKAAYEIAGK